MALTHPELPPDLPARLFQVGFRFVAEARDLNPQLAKECILALELHDGPGGISGALHYDPQSFTSEVVIAMTEQYRVLLDRIVENPDFFISDLASDLSLASGSAVVAAEDANQLEDQFAF